MSVNIEKNIPVPDSGKYATVIREMAIGDSVLLESRTQCATFRARANRLGFKVTSRREEDKKFRVWRIK